MHGDIRETKRIQDALEISPSQHQPNSPINTVGKPIGGKSSSGKGPESGFQMPPKGKPKHSGSGSKY